MSSNNGPKQHALQHSAGLCKQVTCLEVLRSGCTWSVTKHSAGTVNDKQINSLSGNFSGVTCDCSLQTSTCSWDSACQIWLDPLPAITPFPCWGCLLHAHSQGHRLTLTPCGLATGLRERWRMGFQCTLDGHPLGQTHVPGKSAANR